MKRVLIILLALAFCEANAQKDRKLYSLPGDTVVYHPPTNIQLINAGHIGVFLELYSRYERECWNDSTQVKQHFGNPPCVGISRGGDDFHCDSFGHYDAMVWIHRRAFFEDFMTWLRKQIQK